MPPGDPSTTAFLSTDQLSGVAAARPRLAPIPALTVLGHANLDRLGDRALLGELASGRTLPLARQTPSFKAPGSPAGEPLADRFLSRRPLHLEPRADGGVELSRRGSRTEVIVDGEAMGESCVLSAEALRRGAVIELANRVALLLHLHPPECDEPDLGHGLVGASAALSEVRHAIDRLGAFEVPVLLRGETGTGKELVARALHEHGPRRGGPFVSVSLAALTPSLAAAELFGASKGAYTGASRDREGYFGRADGGTLFLDEIGETPVEVQAMLLRVLETGEVFAAGSRTPRRVSVRVVSATDADLEALGSAGDFRTPLLHRLAGYTLRLPALRERRDDVGRLLIHFLRRELRRVGEMPPPDASPNRPWLPTALLSRLARHPWPGNVRQLSNVARQLVIDGRGRPSLDLWPQIEHLLDEEAPPEPSAAAAPRPRPKTAGGRRKPSRIPEEELLAALREHRFNLKAAAAALGIPRTSLYSLIERSAAIRSAADVPADEVREAFRRHGGRIQDMAAHLEVSGRGLRQRLKDLGLRPAPAARRSPEP